MASGYHIVQYSSKVLLFLLNCIMFYCVPSVSRVHLNFLECLAVAGALEHGVNKITVPEVHPLSQPEGVNLGMGKFGTEHAV